MTTRLTIDLEPGVAALLRSRAEANDTDVSTLVSHIVELALSGEPSSAQMAELIDHGGAFAWLADEPDLYSHEDGIPYAAG